MSAILLFVKRLKNYEIYDREGNKLGTIADVMLNHDLTHAEYVVMAFSGGLTAAKKSFAVPVGALELDTENECFVLDVGKDRLAAADGFAADAPPAVADSLFTPALPHAASSSVRIPNANRAPT